MARLRQQYPQNYGSSGNISAEFESIVRYLNSAEYGNNTLSELLAKLFDDSGVFDGPVELRKDSSAGLQYRVGEYTDPSEGWKTLATLAELRGEDGQDFGEIGAPIIHARADYVATAGQTVFDYAHLSTDELIVYKNGLLLREGSSYAYTTSPTAGTGGAGAVTLTAGATVGDTLSIYKIRATAITGFLRSDIIPATSQAVFSFVHDDTTKLQVYKNGILQREGGSFDYTTQPANNTVTFNANQTTSDTISIITVENTSATAVTGMMFEENFANTSTGLIRFDKIGFADGDIPQAKVASLITDLGNRTVLYTSANAPTSSSTPVPVQGNLWLNTTDDTLHFYSSQSTWINATPESSLPSFNTANANQFVKVNGTGTALQYASVDLSSVIPITQKGAASGVAELDSTGRLVESQLPTALGSDTVSVFIAAPNNGTGTYLKSIFKQNIKITHIRAVTDSGTIDVNVQANGVDVMTADLAANSTGNTFTLPTPYELNATNAPIKLTLDLANDSSATNLEVIIALTINS